MTLLIDESLGRVRRMRMKRANEPCRRCGGFILADVDGDRRCFQCGRPYRQPAPSIKPRDVGLTSCVSCRSPFFLVSGHLCAPPVVKRRRVFEGGDLKLVPA